MMKLWAEAVFAAHNSVCNNASFKSCVGCNLANRLFKRF